MQTVLSLSASERIDNDMKKWISLLLVLVMVFSLSGGLGISAYAEDLAENAVTEETADTEETSDGELLKEEPVAEELLKEEIPEEEPVTEEPAAEALPEEETVEEESEDEEEETIDDSEKYVFTKSVSSGSAYVLAYRDYEGVYHVVAVRDGTLVVLDTETLTENSVAQLEKGVFDEETYTYISEPASVFWSVSGEGNLALLNNGQYLNAENGYLDLTDSHVGAWDYNAERGYVDYTTWADVNYIITVSEGFVSAYSGDLSNASGRVVFYAPESIAVAELPQFRGGARTSEANYNYHYIAVASDRHSTPSAIGNAMSNMPENVEYVVLDGDMEDATANYRTSVMYSEVQAVFGSGINVSIVKASHDENAIDDAGILLPYSGQFYPSGEASETTPYYLYVVSWDDMKYNSNSADDFTAWASEHDDGYPIIVVCHQPLHSTRDNSAALEWSVALNDVAYDSDSQTIRRNVIFLHGHNHTNENNAEYYYAPGSTLSVRGNNMTIYYTYITAGYLRNNTSATLIGIGENDITLQKYVNGSAVSGRATGFNSMNNSYSGGMVQGFSEVIERVSVGVIDTFTVTFDSQGGSTVDPQMVESGSKAIQPEDPTKDGFVFDGWYNGETEYDFETPVTADLELTAKWTSQIKYGYTIQLEDSIDIVYNVKNLTPGTDPGDYIFTYSFLGETNTVSLTDMTANSIKVASCAAKEMTEEVSITVKYKDTVIKETTVSIQKYCLQVINSVTNTELVALCKATLDYGTYAQRTFEYNLDKLANNGTDYNEISSIQIPETVSTKDGTCTGITGRSFTLVTTSKTEFIIYLKHTSDAVMSNYTFTVNGTAYTPTDVSGKYEIRITGIAAKDLDEAYTIVVTNTTDNTVHTYSVSPIAYMYKANDDVNKAFYNYYSTAEAYFAAYGS